MVVIWCPLCAFGRGDEMLAEWILVESLPNTGELEGRIGWAESIERAKLSN
jgi:hypothetical protein